MNKNRQFITAEVPLQIAAAPEGMDALFMAQVMKSDADVLLHIARDDHRMDNLAELVHFFAPDIEILTFPAWDCLPYDRVSPNPDISARRMTTLSRLTGEAPKKRLVITTINAATQMIPARDTLKDHAFLARIGDKIDVDKLSAYLSRNGYARSSTVVEHGDFAIRGGLIDIFPSGQENPVRIDLWGDVIDSMRLFDPISQRTADKIDEISLVPMSEVILDEDSIRRFRGAYVREFGTVRDQDPLYEAVKEGRKHQGMEHWLPYFHFKLESLFDYLPQCPVTMDSLTSEAFSDRLAAIADYYQTRKQALKQTTKGVMAAYKPLPPEKLYLTAEQWQALCEDRKIHQFSAFNAPPDVNHMVLDGHIGRDFAPERTDQKVNVYDSLRQHCIALQAKDRKVLIASYSAGSQNRLAVVLAEHGMVRHQIMDSWASHKALPKDTLGLIILPLEHGFETDGLAIISEQDILGDRLVRKARKSRKAENFIQEASALTPGDLVVHMDHGIGRYENLVTIDVNGASHDCVHLTYHGGDKLYVPVENIEILSRYGSEGSDGQLDKLGGVAWQGRKAKLKKRIRDMADELIKVAAQRALRKGAIIQPPEGLYDEFCARFPYTETDDQLRAIADVVTDLGSGKPMDRLICGDVGFGKTEVALRAAFLGVMEGFQVAIIAPTTLLVRQHYKTFTDRFRGLPVKIGHLSRLVSAKDQKLTRAELAAGTCEIVIGTHALLGKSVSFKNLGLIVIDEEQHFGVAHKERLKKMKNDVHVLTLTATPIPRTLQLAMSGMRGLSLIATPPVDRLAIRTFVLPMDSMIIREALLREHYRGGQSFYVCPRVSDLKEIEDLLREHVPEVKTVTAHGQMAPTQIEDVMNAFYDGKYDVLISTTIVESGLDIPTANTMIIHRADMFGLSQLYQLRGRVGRSKVRAYAYLTLPPRRMPTAQAEKRLQVLQTLDTLGAGFTLASHDLDIRGAGNLLGEEQSGHIKEVGMELYQQMLEEAVAEARGGITDDEISGVWSPQINVGAAVLIPESYVPDLNLRMSLYRRLAELKGRQDIDAFGAELIDRFGDLPEEVEHLLKIILIKHFCRLAGIEKIDTGPKGAIVTFRGSKFANPAGLIEFISNQSTITKLRTDHRLVYVRKWSRIENRLQGSLNLAHALAKAARP
ncbi:Transcription-repair coupling factor [hydrothermal vent metagenome]|uniref:Transcription-repair coupling factor n=1 Tax=hydrothermal vent metagenome TaxID=652676 RepID=A0A3B0R3G1_9ZZZZ